MEQGVGFIFDKADVGNMLHRHSNDFLPKGDGLIGSQAENLRVAEKFGSRWLMTGLRDVSPDAIWQGIQHFQDIDLSATFSLIWK
jgi:hypothetical protein